MCSMLQQLNNQPNCGCMHNTIEENIRKFLLPGHEPDLGVCRLGSSKLGLLMKLFQIFCRKVSHIFFAAFSLY